MFWLYLSTEILWVIWKVQNGDKFKGHRRVLTNSCKRLIVYNVSMQVYITIEITKDKFWKFLEHNTVNIDIQEARYGHIWQDRHLGVEIFLKALQDFQKELKEGTKNKEGETQANKAMVEHEATKTLISMKGTIGNNKCSG